MESNSDNQNLILSVDAMRTVIDSSALQASECYHDLINTMPNFTYGLVYAAENSTLYNLDRDLLFFYIMVLRAFVCGDTSQTIYIESRESVTHLLTLYSWVMVEPTSLIFHMADYAHRLTGDREPWRKALILTAEPGFDIFPLPQDELFPLIVDQYLNEYVLSLPAFGDPMGTAEHVANRIVPSMRLPSRPSDWLLERFSLALAKLVRRFYMDQDVVSEELDNINQHISTAAGREGFHHIAI
jgi:hypothetical protein